MFPRNWILRRTNTRDSCRVYQFTVKEKGHRDKVTMVFDQKKSSASPDSVPDMTYQIYEILLEERDRMAFEMEGPDHDVYEFVTPYGNGCYFEGTNRFRKGVHTVHYQYQTKRWLITIVIDCNSHQSRVIDEVFSYLKDTSDQDLSQMILGNRPDRIVENEPISDAITQLVRELDFSNVFIEIIAIAFQASVSPS